MKGMKIGLVCIFIAVSGYAQQGAVDLSKDPVKPRATLPKSNAQLLKETGTQPAQSNTDLSEQYKPDAANSGTSTSKGLAPVTTTPGQLPASPQMMNNTNTQYSLGNGTKANTTIYYDDAGKVQSSGTSIQFGNKKK